MKTRSTQEQLRVNHIETLEVLQKTSDENEKLKAELSKLKTLQQEHSSVDFSEIQAENQRLLVIIVDKTNEIKRLSLSNSHLDVELMRSKSEHINQQKTTEYEKSKVKKLTEEITSFNSIIHDNGERLIKVQNQLLHWETKCKDLEGEKKSLLVLISQMKENAYLSENVHENYQSKTQCLQIRIDELIQESQLLRERLTFLESDNHRHLSTIQTIQSERDSLSLSLSLSQSLSLPSSSPSPSSICCQCQLNIPPQHQSSSLLQPNPSPSLSPSTSLHPPSVPLSLSSPSSQEQEQEEIINRLQSLLHTLEIKLKEQDHKYQLLMEEYTLYKLSHTASSSPNIDILISSSPSSSSSSNQSNSSSSASSSSSSSSSSSPSPPFEEFVALKKEIKQLKLQIALLKEEQSSSSQTKGKKHNLLQQLEPSSSPSLSSSSSSVISDSNSFLPPPHLTRKEIRPITNHNNNNNNNGEATTIPMRNKNTFPSINNNNNNNNNNNKTILRK